MALIYHDPRFRFVGANRVGGVCDLKVYNIVTGIADALVRLQVAIASALILTNGDYADSGVSITNAYEQMATRVRADLGFVPEMWVEFYPDRGYMLAERRAAGQAPESQEDFAFVTLTWEAGNQYRPGAYRHPQWKYATRAQIESLIGEKFQYEYCTEKVE